MLRPRNAPTNTVGAYSFPPRRVIYRHQDGATVRVGAEATPSTAAPALWGVLTIAGTAMGAFHGYRRNNSIGWAIGWAVLGGLFPVIAIPIMLAQGFGKKP